MPRQHIKSPQKLRNSKQGIALLMTLIVVILFAIIAFHYVYVTKTYTLVVNNQRDEVTASWLARGGLYRARAQLKLDEELAFDSLNEDWARPLVYGEDDSPTGLQPNVRISDEESKFNILLLDWEDASEENQERIRETFVRLIRVLRRKDERLKLGEDGESIRSTRGSRDDDDISPKALHDGIRDYLKKREKDLDRKITFNKGEKEKGSVKASPFALLTLRELIHAEKMTEKVLFGPQNMVFRIHHEDQDEEDKREYDPATGYALNEREQALQAADSSRIQDDLARSRSERSLPLADYLTLWGDGRINMNTASREVLLALSEHLSWDMVEDILRARDEAYDRERLIEEEEEAEPNNALPEEDEEEEDQRSFRDEDLNSALNFYNRIYQNLETSEDGTPRDPVDAPENVPEAWRNAFNDMQPFMKARSRYFKVRSHVEHKKMRVKKTYTAVYRRDRLQESPSEKELSFNEENLPDEPDIALTLIFLDEEE